MKTGQNGREVKRNLVVDTISMKILGLISTIPPSYNNNNNNNHNNNNGNDEDADEKKEGEEEGQ